MRGALIILAGALIAGCGGGKIADSKGPIAERKPMPALRHTIKIGPGPIEGRVPYFLTNTTVVLLPGVYTVQPTWSAYLVDSIIEGAGATVRLAGGTSSQPLLRASGQRFSVRGLTVDGSGVNPLIGLVRTSGTDGNWIGVTITNARCMGTFNHSEGFAIVASYATNYLFGGCQIFLDGNTQGISIWCGERNTVRACEFSGTAPMQGRWQSGVQPYGHHTLVEQCRFQRLSAGVYGDYLYDLGARYTWTGLTVRNCTYEVCLTTVMLGPDTRHNRWEQIIID